MKDYSRLIVVYLIFTIGIRIIVGAFKNMNELDELKQDIETLDNELRLLKVGSSD